MAINIPILTEFDSKGLQSAQGAFNNFKSKVGEAEGAMGKFKAGGTAALDALKANAGTFAMAAGAAIAGFAVKAISDFQNLALEVDKFSNVTGIAAEEASKWVEVTGDVGIEAGVVEGAINRMNREIAKGTEEFEKLGIEVVKTADGAVDTNETFLNTIEVLKNIKDPTERATVAAELLGKGWTGMAELIEMGADTLRSSLDSVSNAKIIDEKEIDKAKRFRDTQDELKGAFEDVSLAVGEFLIPALTNGANAVTKLTDAIGPLLSVAGKFTGELDLWDVTAVGFVKNAGEKLWGWIKGTDDNTEELAKTTGEALAQWIYYESGVMDVIDASRKLTGETETLTDAVTLLDQAWSDLLGEVDKREAWRNLQEELQQADDKIAEVFAQNTPEAMAIAAAAIDDQIVAIAKYVDFMESEIPDFIETKILAALDNGQIEEARRLLELKIGEPIYVDVIPNPLLPGGPRAAFMEEGDRVSNPRPTIPGGQMKPGYDNPLTQSRRDLEAGLLAIGGQRERQTVIVNVGGSVISSEDLIEKIRKGLVDSQRNGNQLVYTNK